MEPPDRDPPRTPFRMVTFDIDGTLTRGHGWAHIARSLGKDAEYAATPEAFLRGKESEEVHLVNLLNLAAGVPLTALEVLLEETPKLSGISETVGDLTARGVIPALLTHNPSYVCRWYCRTFGFAGFSGSEQEVRGGVIQPVHLAEADKVGGLRSLTQRWGIPPEATLHVGDAPADVAVADFTGGFVALNADREGVRARADRVLLTEDLRDVIPLVATVFHPPRRILLPVVHPSGDRGGCERS